MISGALRIIAYVATILIPLILVSVMHPPSPRPVYEFGRALALTGLMILFLQPLLAGRFKWMERPFGFDILIRFHRHMAVAATFFLLFHPAMLALGGAGARLLVSFRVPWYIWLGRAALILLIANTALSLYQIPFGFKFEKWRVLHDILGPAIIGFGFLHSRFTGEELARNDFLRAAWPVLLFLAVGVFVYHRFIRPIRLARRPYRVAEVRPEADGVWTIKMEPPEGIARYDYLPGQFQFITFQRSRHLPVEEHHWTISSSPTQTGFVSSTIKALGDFTSTIGHTKPGDTAVIHAPFGRFSHLVHPDERDLVFIAGGIGVTPLMSMLRYMRDTGSEISVIFLYGNKKENEIVFRQELDKIASGRRPRLKLVHVLAYPEGAWEGETGLIDKEKIERFCAGNFDRTFYLCGPHGLIDASLRNLKGLGIPDRRIRLEVFTFL